MKVSVITPTFGRREKLESLYGVFDGQTHRDKELLIYDDSPSPSRFFLELKDERVRYFHSPERAIIGAKRDWLVRATRGEVIAQFDDDDYYAPDYVATMLEELGSHDLVKLSKWFLLERTSGGCFYWDSTRIMPVHYRVACGEPPMPLSLDGRPEQRADWRDRNLWGYGFSYVFRRDVYNVAQFDPRMGKGQDYAFVQACWRAGRKKMRAVPDESGLALHVIHDSNTSRAFPNFMLPSFVLPKIFGPHVQSFLSNTRAVAHDASTRSQ